LNRAENELTLPPVVASAQGRYREPALMLTLVFHPDTGRIGESAEVPRSGAHPCLLGRNHPAFSLLDAEEGRPLADPHVSRRAVELDYDGRRVRLIRFTDSSRCRVAGRELENVITLDLEHLQSGVPLLLGHSVVLMLRLAGNVMGESGAADGALHGSSRYMQGLRARIARAAASDLDVLVRGETGTGKELVASAIHRESGRSRANLVSVNMAAIAPELAPAALFGSARGAFTGAHRAAPGYFQQARGGTLFLDEIGDAPPAVQPLLLRALQQREIQVVGGPIESVDLRVISATDADLESDLCDFKSALLHRLGAFDIDLLPLREHPEDIGELLLHFLSKSAREAGKSGLLPDESSPALDIAAWADLFHTCLRYQWPGNVRELANCASQVVHASETTPVLPDKLNKTLRQAARREPLETEDDAPRQRRTILDVSEPEFDRAWELSRYSVTGTARQLGVSRAAVYRRIEESPRYRLAGQVPLAELRRVVAEHPGDLVPAAAAMRVSLAGLRARLRALGRKAQ
jgi:two-component system nitrogen regulation response regulator GlnG